MNGALSMSPIVPPTSVMMKSKLSSNPSRSILRLISSVMWGTTWMVLPR